MRDASPAVRMPAARALAALGTVLCVYPPRPSGELGGWSRATHAVCLSALDSDGLRECIAFFDAHGHGCWRLYLLPDTDMLAWEHLAQWLPARCAEHEPRPGIAERLWRRWSRDSGATAWRACVLRLHALPGGPGYATLSMLAASQAPLSALGGEAARRILRSEGVLDRSAVDDCCCLHAAARSPAPAPTVASAGATSHPLTLFNTRSLA